MKRKVVKAWAVWNSFDDYLIRGLYSDRFLIHATPEQAELALDGRSTLKVMPVTITYELPRKARKKAS